MADRLAPGAPYRVLDLGDGQTAPFYIVPFDRDGICTGPLTARNLVATVREHQPTDVFLFSHGWNNDWEAASTRYDEFVDGFARMRARYPLGREFRPVLVGVFWPSTALVAPWEKAPDIAAVGDDAAVAEERAEVAEVAAVVPAGQRARFYELAQRPADLSEEEAAEFADLVVGAFAGDDELGEPAATGQGVLDVWRALPGRARAVAPDEFERVGWPVSQPPVTAASDADVRAAGLLGALDPRGLVRLATVLLMKDRAGRVGARGVAELLTDLLDASPAAVHLIGHSYGAKVMLSALVARPHPREVESVLLLQPAVSHLCFAADVDGRAGGYRPALRRSRQPVMTTYSRHDFPLTKVFHWAVRRRSDLGEVAISGAPNRYAALGGFGPGGIDDEVSVIRAAIPPSPYPDPPSGARVVAVDASDVIKGHGEVQVPGTFWMLLTQVARTGR